MSLHRKPYDIAAVDPAPCLVYEAKLTRPKGSGPTLDVLRDQSIPRGTSVTLRVTFRATTPVTIIWRVDLTEVWRRDARVPHGQTRLTIRHFDYQHHRKRFSVEIVDQRGRRVWTAGTLKIRY